MNRLLGFLLLPALAVPIVVAAGVAYVEELQRLAWADAWDDVLAISLRDDDEHEEAA